MPTKKKKKHTAGKDTSTSTASSTTEQDDSVQQQEDGGLPQEDALTCLDELDKLIGADASLDRTKCVEGIRKADEAIGKCVADGDLQCALRLKRAQLLKAVVEKRYDIEGLASQHKAPLDSGIVDCQQVLSGLKNSDSSPAAYREAQALLTCIMKLKRDVDPNVRTRSRATVYVAPSQKNATSTVSPLYFDPAKTQFKDVADIHPALLQDIVNCYKKYKYVCRTCFIRYNRQEILVGGRPCRRCRNTTTTRIMPASKMCKNFRDLKVLAIPPPPKVLMAPTNRHKPFLYCRNVDHLLCYDLAKESWYAHSMDELVIWTVERYWGCSFTEYINNLHSDQYATSVAASSGDKKPGKSSTKKIKNVDNVDSFSDGPDYDFYPSDTLFPRGVASIPRHLLDDVIKCFNDRREYCKLCFYKLGKKGEMSNSPQGTSLCKLCRRSWQRVVVMPSSTLCWNFGDFDVIPIAPIPRTKSTSFKYCTNDDHFRCFRLYIDNEFWYAHTVEEMVIWTVERDKGCSFGQYVNNKTSRKPLPPPGLTLPSSPSSAPISPISPSHQNHVPSKTRKMPPASSSGTGEKEGVLSPGKTPTTPSFSEVVSGPPLKNRPPSSGKFKGWGATGRDKPASAAAISDIDAISLCSTNSGLEPLGTSKVPSSTSSAPPNASGKGTFDNLTPLGQQPPKSRRHSEESYMTALSQDTNLSSQGNSQESGHSGPIKSRTVPNTKNTKASFNKGRPNYKVAKPGKNSDKMDDAVSDGGRSSTNFDDVLPNQLDSNCTSLTASQVADSEAELSTNDGVTQSLSEKDAAFEAKSATCAPFAPSRVTTSSDVVPPETKSSSFASSDFVASPQDDNASSNSSFVPPKSSVTMSHPPGYHSRPNHPLRVDNVVNSNHRGITRSQSGTSVTGGKEQREVFKFLQVNYRTCAEIPVPLIVAIATAFRDRQEVCRKCFFGERSLSYEEVGGVCGEGEHAWDNPVIVIPGCKECNNEPCFDAGDYVPLPPLPPIANIRKCSQKNHHKCFQKSLESNPKFAHSVEQLVVWLIESEKDCSFLDFVNSELQSLVHMSPPTPDSTSHQTTGISTAPITHGQFNTSEPRPPPSPVPRHSIPVPSTATKTNRPPPTHPNPTRPPPLNSQPQPLTPKYNAQNGSGVEPLDAGNTMSQTSSGGGTMVDGTGQGDVGTNEAVMADDTSVLKVVSDNPVPVPDPQNGNGTMVHLNSSEQTGIGTVPVSLFHDPLMYYDASTNVSDDTGHYDNNEHDAALSYFPALRANVAMETAESCNDPATPSNEDVNERGDIALTSGHNVMEMTTTDDPMAMVQSTGRDSDCVSDANEQESVADSPSLTEQFENVDHNQYRSKKSGAMPENWPNVVHRQSPPNSDSLGENHRLVSPDNCQGQEVSPPCSSSQGSSCAFEMDQKKDCSAEKDVVDANSDKRDCASGAVKDGPVCSANGTNNDSVLSNAARNDGLASTNSSSENDSAVDHLPGSKNGGAVHSHSRSDTVDKKADSSSGDIDSTSDQVASDKTSLSSASSSSSTGDHKITPTSSPTTSEPDSAATTAPQVMRRDSLDVNAKEFTPRAVVIQNVLPEFPMGMYHPAALNPNATVYPYLTNGVIPVRVPVLPPRLLAKSMNSVGGGGGRGWRGAGNVLSVGDAPNVTGATTKSSSPRPSVSNISPTALSPPSSPAHPHKCLLCYQTFPDRPSLQRHCKTAAHISTLLRDCGASTIWKHLPPPPGQPREHMKLCLNGESCTASRVDCSQPHFADEFAEQLRRIDHHSKREASREPLPEFSEQRDGLLISPIEKITHYTTLKVSVGEPLKAVLDDASVSFTWTITIQGQNWQTLFGIHLKGPAPIFHITDTEGANTQASGNCKSDRANWVANSPSNAILLGRVSFSVRATPDKMNKNYSCRVCLNLGFYQYAYISLALVVKGHNDTNIGKRISNSSLPPPPPPPSLDEYPPITETSRGNGSTSQQRRSQAPPRPARPQSNNADKQSSDQQAPPRPQVDKQAQARPQSVKVDKQSSDQQAPARPQVDKQAQARPQSAKVDKQTSDQQAPARPQVNKQAQARPQSAKVDKQSSDQQAPARPQVDKQSSDQQAPARPKSAKADQQAPARPQGVHVDKRSLDQQVPARQQNVGEPIGDSDRSNLNKAKHSVQLLRRSTSQKASGSGTSERGEGGEEVGRGGSGSGEARTGSRVTHQQFSSDEDRGDSIVEESSDSSHLDHMTSDDVITSPITASHSSPNLC